MVKSDTLLLAGLGVGALFLFRKDVSKTVEGVSTATKGLGEGITQVSGGIGTGVQGLGQGISTIGKEAGELVENVGNVGDALSDVVSGGIRKIGEVSGDIVQSIQNVPGNIREIVKNKSLKSQSKNTTVKTQPTPGTKTGSLVLDRVLKTSQNQPVSIFNQSQKSLKSTPKTTTTTKSSSSSSKNKSVKSSSSSKPKVNSAILSKDPKTLNAVQRRIVNQLKS